MALVPCRECKTMISTSAASCPQCKATDPASKVSRQQKKLRTFIWFRIILPVALITGSSLYFWYWVLPALRHGTLN